MRVLITGTSGGLGEAIAIEANNRGHIVFDHHRRGVEPDWFLCGNITDYDFVEKFGDFLKVHDINVFVNNAAMYCGGPIEDTSDHLIRKVIDTNVTSQILIMKEAYRRFKSIGEGLIININSLSYQQPSKNETIYCASKFAMKGFSKALQMEAIGTGVEIIDVHPGGIQTNMTKDRDNYSSLMTREDVASQVTNLMDRGSNYVNEIILRKRNESSGS